jgi:putative spermidine/putrescine transport system permease protein
MQFQETFGYSMLMALLTIVFGMLLVVPTAYWVRLRLPQMRPVVEFITLLPLVIPAIVIVFGYLRMYNSNSPLPLTGSARGTDAAAVSRLCDAVAALHVPRGRYRPAHHRRAHADGSGESLGAGWTTIMFACICPMS